MNSGALCAPTCSGGPEPRPLVATAEHIFHEEGTGATETGVSVEMFKLQAYFDSWQNWQEEHRFSAPGFLLALRTRDRAARAVRGWGRRAAESSLVRPRPMACEPGPPPRISRCPPSFSEGWRPGPASWRAAGQPASAAGAR